MSDIAPVGRPVPATYAHNGRAARSLGSTVNGTPRHDDTVEFSRTAQLLAKLQEIPSVRQDLVDRVSTQVADGTYESEEKLDAAVDALFADLAE